MDSTKAIYFLLILCYEAPPIFCQGCPNIPCDVRTYNCQYRTFYYVPLLRRVCRGCNLCIPQDSPVDSEGCPVMECPGPKPADMCSRPGYAYSKVDFNGKQCPTCWAQLCEIFKSD